MKKLITGILLCSFMITLLAGCATENKAKNDEKKPGETEVSNDNKETDSEKEEEQVTLVYYHWDTTGVVQKQIDEFEKKNPNIKVNLILTPNSEYFDKLKITLSGGGDVDVYASQDGSKYAQTATQFKAVPLDTYIKKDSWDVTNFGSTLESSMVDGQLLGIPTVKNGFLLYYNKNLFDAAGVDYPSNDMTWEEYAALAKEMTKGEGETKVWGSFLQNWAQLWYMPQVQEGRTIFDDNLDTAKAGLDLRIQMQNVDQSEMPWAEVVSGKIHHRDAFAKGNLAMMVIGDWMISILNNFQEDGTIDFDYDITFPPHPEGVAAGTTIGGPSTFLSINGKSEHKEEAWELIKFMTGEEGSLIFAGEKQSPAYVNEEIINAFLGGDTPQPANLQAFLNLNAIPIFPFKEGAQDIDKIMTEEGELAFIGEQTTEETFKNIVERRAEELKKYE